MSFWEKVSEFLGAVAFLALLLLGFWFLFLVDGGEPVKSAPPAVQESVGEEPREEGGAEE